MLNELIVATTGQVATVTYDWDAEQRLVAINQGTNCSEFSYDGQGHRVKIVEKTNGMLASEKRFIWCNDTICQELATGGTAQEQFFSQGVKLPAGSLFYTRDHLGSIRELSDASAATRARYIYGPFGLSTKLGGDLAPDFGFTGHYRHTPSALNLTFYRAYDARQGRWLSRDKIAHPNESSPYTYVRNSPVGLVDLDGRAPIETTPYWIPHELPPVFTPTPGPTVPAVPGPAAPQLPWTPGGDLAPGLHDPCIRCILDMEFTGLGTYEAIGSIVAKESVPYVGLAASVYSLIAAYENCAACGRIQNVERNGPCR